MAEVSDNATFAFRKHDSVGSASAEDDTQFLAECFVDTGDLALLRDCDCPKRIIVGRTGAGKSALLFALSQTNGHVVQLSPHDLSLNFIATNKVLAFYEQVGVNLSAFYVLLWKHLLVVELLKKKFNILTEDTHRSFISNMKSLLYKKDRYKALAVEYLEEWGNKFWLTSEQRVHELTERVESKLSAELGGRLPGVTLSAEGAQTLTEEQRKQVVEHGHDAVSRVQIRELDGIINVLEDHVFDDRKDHYYVAIDMLDEDWADNRIKFKLIRALIDSVRRFKSIPNVKIVLALRQDLLDKVITFEITSGFQEEKYKSLYLEIRWNKQDLITLVERRINQLIRRRYTKGDVSFVDIFPRHVDGKDAMDYMLERTFYRPRDIILFVNECLELADGRPTITAGIIKDAEQRYSLERLQSLAYEWILIWPSLFHTAQLFYGLKDRFEVSELTEEFCTERFTQLARDLRDTDADSIVRALENLCTEHGNFSSIRNLALREFYSTGLIGIKTGPTNSVSWARDNARARLTAGDVRPTSIVFVHPMFHRALGIKYSR